MFSRARFYAALLTLSYSLYPNVTAVTDEEWIYKTYWLDNSCAQYPLQETMAQSQRGAQRLADANDNNDELIFNLLWQKHRTDVDTWQDVSNISRWNGGLVQQWDRDTADIRIYCDNNRGPRWQIVPDLPQGQEPYPIWKQNSERDFGIDQTWYDAANYMRASPVTEGCVDEATWAWTIQTQYYPDGTKIPIGNSLQFEDPNTPAGYQSPRAIITLCDRAFGSGYKSINELALKDLSLLQDMDPFALLPTFTLGEQIKTLAPFYKVSEEALGDLVFDGSPDSPGSEGSAGSAGSEGDGLLTSWQISTMITANQAIVYANNFVWHDVLALLADWGWTLKGGLTTAQYRTGKNILKYPWPLRNQDPV